MFVSLTVFIVLGLTLQQGQCQFGMRGGGMPGNMGMLSMLGIGGMEPADLFPMMAMAGASGSGGGGSSAGGGLDPTTLMLLSQSGGGLGGGLGEMLPILMLSQSMNQNQQQATGPTLNPMAAELLRYLGNSGTGIGPAKQASLWHLVSMNKKTGEIFKAVSNPEMKIKLEKSGLIANLNPLLKMSVCPRVMPIRCPIAVCESPKMLHTPESFYICRGCPKCPLDASQRKMLDMMKMMNPGATPHEVNEMASHLSMIKAIQSSGNNPMMVAAMMKSMKSSQMKRKMRKQMKEKKKAGKMKAGKLTSVQMVPGKGVQMMPGQPPMMPPNNPGMLPGQAMQMVPGQMMTTQQRITVIPNPQMQMILGQQMMPGQQMIPGQQIQMVPGQPMQMMPVQPMPMYPVSPGQVVPPQQGKPVPGQPPMTYKPVQSGTPSAGSNKAIKPPMPPMPPMGDKSLNNPPQEFVAVLNKMREQMLSKRKQLLAGNQGPSKKGPPKPPPKK